MPPTDRRSRDDPDAGPPGAASPQRVQVALVAGPSPRPAAEVETLLRRRLRFIGLLSTAVWGVASVLFAFQVALDKRPPAEVWLDAASAWAMFLVVVRGMGMR